MLDAVRIIQRALLATAMLVIIMLPASETGQTGREDGSVPTATLVGVLP